MYPSTQNHHIHCNCLTCRKERSQARALNKQPLSSEFEEQFLGAISGWFSGSQGQVDRNSQAYIRWVQAALNKISGLRLAADGIKGSQTSSAVRDFQRRQGLTVDGIIEANTEKALINAGAGQPPKVSTGQPPTVPTPSGTGSTAQLATSILNNANITLATRHVSGVNDKATAYQNITDTAKGTAASRSSYGNAPGGTVQLDTWLLGGILQLAQKYSFAISEIAGGSHSSKSRHYAGIAVDVNVINGRHVGASHPDVPIFMQAGRNLGATEVLGPGNEGHDTHIHFAWPRP